MKRINQILTMFIVGAIIIAVVFYLAAIMEGIDALVGI